MYKYIDFRTEQFSRTLRSEKKSAHLEKDEAEYDK